MKVLIKGFLTVAIVALGHQVLLGRPDFEQRVVALKNVRSKSQVDSVCSILYDLTLGQRETELQFCGKMLEMKDQLEGEAYFMVLRHYAKIAPCNNQQLFDEVIQNIHLNHLDQYTSSVYVLKSEFFKQKMIYDSAMVNILLAHDEAFRFNNIEQKVNVLHLLGDLYYSTGYYQRAMYYYKKVQEMKGNPPSWNEWRRRVIRNNMGLIEMNMGNPQNALQLFNVSLYEIKLPLKYGPDSLAFAFIAYCKSLSYFDLNQLPQAKDDLDRAESIFVKLRDKTTLLQINLLRTQIALKENHQQLAARLFEKAMSTTDTNHIGQLLKNQIILLKSEILAAEGKYEEALYYNRRYSKLNDQLYKEQKALQLLQIQSENEYVIVQKDKLHTKSLQFLISFSKKTFNCQ